MGLYLCVFDLGHDEKDGVEVGLYEDYCEFIDAVVRHVERGARGTVCPTLTIHSDCDGIWALDEIEALVAELKEVRQTFSSLPPEEPKSGWKLEIVRKVGLKLRNLNDCFFDIDGENLLERLFQLCATAKSIGQPIQFQ